MKVYGHRDFKGHWPVGAAAVVVAASKEEATKELEAELAKCGLSQKVDTDRFIEISTDLQKVHVLCDGVY